MPKVSNDLHEDVAAKIEWDEVYRKTWKEEYSMSWRGDSFTTSIYGPGDSVPSIKEEEGVREFATGAVRGAIEGKGRFDAIPTCALKRLAAHYEKGILRYGERNWQRGIPCSSYIDSAMRHLVQVAEGKTDEDHIAAVMWNMASLMWTLEQIEKEKLSADLDNRPYRELSAVPMDVTYKKE